MGRTQAKSTFQNKLFPYNEPVGSIALIGNILSYGHAVHRVEGVTMSAENQLYYQYFQSTNHMHISFRIQRQARTLERWIDDSC